MNPAIHFRNGPKAANQPGNKLQTKQNTLQTRFKRIKFFVAAKQRSICIGGFEPRQKTGLNSIRDDNRSTALHFHARFFGGRRMAWGRRAPPLRGAGWLAEACGALEWVKRDHS